MTFVLSIAGFAAFSQNYLYKPVKLHVNQKKLGNVLEDIGRQAGFHFSYSSGIIRSDSLVTIRNFDGDVKTALVTLLGNGYEYQQSPNHLIIRPAPFRLTLMPEELGEGKRVYTIKGYVVDEKTGVGIHNASVYEKRLLVGTLTDKKGHFKLKLKTKSAGPMVLTVSKELYKDTTTVFLPTVELGKDANKKGHYGYIGDGEEEVSNTALARLFLSSKQKLNALNLGNFFAYTPVQVSLTPGLSSHGMMSGQVVNKFSANLIGGYTAGVNGVELAGIFNIDRYHVRYLQAAGAINMVGGNMSGVQLSGIYNTVIDSLKGFQAAGIFNFVKNSTNGVQLAGIANYTEELKGVQIAGVINKTRTNRGLQFGFINIADTSSGVSIGVVNISKNGIKRLSISSNEVLYVNAAFKSGNANLYSILSTGYGNWKGSQIFTTGFGLGHEFRRKNQANYFAFELVSQQIHGAAYENVSNWQKLNILYNYSLGQKTKLFIAPSLNFLTKNRQIIENARDIPSAGYPYFIDKERSKLWLGIELGVSFF
ncbi:carboxypeptidase-like regulatory domain-containing protein [Olivibacter sp. CPCC 100613]|uniref:carboxypeptidase-like regulatory domain-containing protein n=1 Tax=Olivibacter sp. CPCC 100613 TaxID=3079931 RepID=UPI002FF9B475